MVNITIDNHTIAVPSGTTDHGSSSLHSYTDSKALLFKDIKKLERAESAL